MILSSIRFLLLAPAGIFPLPVRGQIPLCRKSSPGYMLLSSPVRLWLLRICRQGGGWRNENAIAALRHFPTVAGSPAHCKACAAPVN